MECNNSLGQEAYWIYETVEKAARVYTRENRRGVCCGVLDLSASSSLISFP